MPDVTFRESMVMGGRTEDIVRDESYHRRICGIGAIRFIITIRKSQEIWDKLFMGGKR